MWAMSQKTVRRLFEKEDGVFRWGSKRRFALAAQPSVQRVLTNPYLSCDRQFAFAFDYCSLVPRSQNQKQNSSLKNPHVLKRGCHPRFASHPSNHSSITACKNILYRFKRKKCPVLIRPLLAGFDSTT